MGIKTVTTWMDLRTRGFNYTGNSILPLFNQFK